MFYLSLMITTQLKPIVYLKEINRRKKNQFTKKGTKVGDRKSKLQLLPTKPKPTNQTKKQKTIG